MKEYDFPAFCNFGKGDSGESVITFELTDEESARLDALASDEDVYFNEFFRCSKLEDIYKKVYTAAVEQITEELISYDIVENKPDNWKASDDYYIEVLFPTKFEP